MKRAMKKMNWTMTKAKRNNTMTYMWVERSAALTPFSGRFSTPESAIEWAKEWKKDSFMTPEHMHIFLIQIDENRCADIFRWHKNSLPVELGNI